MITFSERYKRHYEVFYGFRREWMEINWKEVEKLGEEWVKEN